MPHPRVRAARDVDEQATVHGLREVFEIVNGQPQAFSGHGGVEFGHGLLKVVEAMVERIGLALVEVVRLGLWIVEVGKVKDAGILAEGAPLRAAQRRYPASRT